MNVVVRSINIKKLHIVITTILISLKIINSLDLNNSNLKLNINCDNKLEGSSLNKIPIKNFRVTSTADRMYESQKVCYFEGKSYLKVSSDPFLSGNNTVSFGFYLENEGNGAILDYGVTQCGMRFVISIDKAFFPKFTILEIDSVCNSNEIILPIKIYFKAYTWYHWIFSTGEAGSKMYINGKLVASNANFKKDFSVGMTNNRNTAMALYT